MRRRPAAVPRSSPLAAPFRGALALLLAVAVLAGGGCALRDGGVGRLAAVATLFAPGDVAANFSRMDKMFESVSMPVPDRAPLPRAAAPAAMPKGFDAWARARNLTSIVVLSQGQLVYENYYLGTGPKDLRISWSLAKSFLATLVGTAVEKGEIASLDDPATAYAPELVGSAWDGVTIRDLLHMASGVAFDENYGNYWSDVNRMSRAMVLGGSLDALAAGLDKRLGPPGRTYRYSSMDTHVLGMVLRGATGKRIPSLMRTRIFAPLGLERDPYYLLDGAGEAFVAGGLGLTTRDYARFGEMVREGGRAGGRQVIPAAWVAEMTRPSAPKGPTGGPGGGFGYHWWIPKNPRAGEIFSRGLYGQRMWIDNARGVVIVVTAADRNEGAPGVARMSEKMFRAIVKAVS